MSPQVPTSNSGVVQPSGITPDQAQALTSCKLALDNVITSAGYKKTRAENELDANWEKTKIRHAELELRDAIRALGGTA